MNRRKILFFISSLAVGGAEKQTIDLLNRLDNAGLATHLCYLENSEQLLQQVNKNRLSGLFHFEKNRRIDLRVLVKSIKLINNIQPDIVVCVNLYPAFYVHLTRNLSRFNFHIVQIMHSTVMRDRYNHLLARFLYRHLANRSDRVVFVCKNQMDYWIKHYGIKQEISTFIHNGVDTEFFKPYSDEKVLVTLRDKFGIRQNHIVFGICANLRPEKRHVDLIDAANILIGKGYPLKILIVGDGIERSNLESHIQSNGLQNHVIIAGSHTDVRPFMSLAQAVVVPSVAVETFSIAILEAMAMAKPIIASDIGGASEQVINGVNGFLFPPANLSELANCLEMMLDKNVCSEMGAQSRAIVCSKFSIQRMIEQYDSLFLEDFSDGKETFR